MPTWRTIVTSLCVVALILPMAAVAAADPEDRLQEVEQETTETRRKLESVQEDRQATVADLRKVETRREELDRELAALNADLSEAEGRLVAAERRLEQTTARLRATEDELDRTRVALDEQRELFGGRARAAYMYGGVGYASIMLDLEDLAEFARSVKYVQEVIAADRRQVELIANLERRVEVAVADLQTLRGEQASQRRVAEGERDEVADLVARQEAVRRQVAAEADRHREIIAQLETDAASYSALLASLEQESADLEAELRRRAEEERRRQEEERRRVEEARRQAEEQRAASARAEQSRREGRPARTDSGSETPSGRMQRPSDGRITSGYGWRTHPISGQRSFHSGVDFGAPTGAPIYAAEAGTVYSAGWRGGYGNTVVIEHGGGLSTLYAHQSRIAVSAGQRVGRGQVIGYIGSTGYSTGPHLHFEVRVNGATRNPMDYL